MPIDITRLPEEFPRTFVPSDVTGAEWAELEPLFKELEARPVDTREALERWLLDRSELNAALYEASAIRYIRMTCHTDNSDYERDYLHFIENVEPHIKPANDRLDRTYLASPARPQLPRARYLVMDRQIENRVALFREENVRLETEDQKLAQRYTKLVGAMTVQFRGREYTLPQMVRFLEEPDRATRQAAWELMLARRFQDREELDQIFDELVQLRDRIARQAGFANYRDYAFRRRERFDYTPDDCARFHRAIETHVVPLVRELQERRRRTLGVDVLRGWDLNVDPEGRPPLRPFEQAEHLMAGCTTIFERMDSELGRDFRRMAELGLLDLESRKGKGPGGYQEDLAEHRLPFIFMNAVGREDDVRTLLHEAGHAFHDFQVRAEPLFTYRSPVTEFSEVASMSMELLGGEHISVFYDPEEAARSKRDHLEGVLNFLPWMAMIDAFQHWIYLHPGHSRAERQAHWLELLGRFGGIESWEGYDTYAGMLWQRQLHLFEVPFYYVEYGIAQLGALGVWKRSQQDWSGAVERYKRALALGNSRPLPELFEAAGVPFDFSPDYVARIIQGLRADLMPDG